MRYAKAIVGALIAGLGTLLTALADDGVEKTEWVVIAISTLTALYGVWQTPNARPVQPVGGEHRVGPRGATVAAAGHVHRVDPVARADAAARRDDPLA